MHMLINGKSVDASDGAVIDVINPATGKLVDTVPSATQEDVTHGAISDVVPRHTRESRENVATTYVKTQRGKE